MKEDERLVLVRELERRDAEAGAALAELDRFYAALARAREEALELDGFFARLPVDRAAAAANVEQTEAALAEAESAAAQGQTELRTAEREGRAERIAAARRFALRTRDAASAAARLAAEAHAEGALLEERAAAAERAAPALQERARELADSLPRHPRLAGDRRAEPPAGLAGIPEWAAGTRAALLVARTALTAEQDALIRQANELAALVLDEPLVAARTAVVARRLASELEEG